MSRPSLDSSNRRDIEMRGFLWRNSTGSCRCWSWHCRCNCIQFQLPTFPNSLSWDLPDPYGAHSGSHSLSHSSGKIVKPGIWFDIIVTECLNLCSAGWNVSHQLHYVHSSAVDNSWANTPHHHWYTFVSHLVFSDRPRPCLARPHSKRNDY